MNAHDPKEDDEFYDPKKSSPTIPEPPKEEYKGKDDDYQDMDIADKVNMELFYNQQITNLNMSWLLHHKESNISIVGITQEHTYGFSVENSYNATGGGAVGQMLSSAINNVHGMISQNAPLMNQALSTWMPQLGKFGKGLTDEITAQEQAASASGEQTERTLGASIQAGIGTGLSTISGWAANWDKERRNSKNLVNKAVGLLFEGKDTPTVDNLANGKMITTTDKVLSYSGSNLSVTLPVLKTYIFHNPLSTMKQNVLDLVNALVRVAAPKTSRSSIDGLYALQNPPGNYHVNFNAFDGQRSPMEGTWTLTWNGYTVKNLLISNLTVNFSKYNAMDNNGLDSGDPLYAEIDITLALASMLMTDDIVNLMTGGMEKRTPRARNRTSGWLDSDESEMGVVSKDADIAGIGTNRKGELTNKNSTSL